MNSKAKEETNPLELVIEKGVGLLRDKLQDHFQRVRSVRSDTAIPESDLVSDALVDRIPRLRWYVRNQISGLRQDMRETIIKLAEKLEHERFEGLNKKVSADLKLSKFQSQRGSRVLSIQERAFVSHASVILACSICARLNKELLTDIEQQRTGLNTDGREMELLLKNALVVYEVAALIVEMIRGFDLDGESDFTALHAEVLKELSEKENNAKELVARARSNPAISQERRDEAVAREKNIRVSASLIRQQWLEFGRKLADLKTGIGSLAKSLHELEFTRDLAKNQLEFLELVAVTQIMGQNIKALELAASVDLEMAPLDVNDICRLIGVGSPAIDVSPPSS